MKSNNPRIARLKEMLSLEERRESLEQELGELSQQLSALKSEISGELSSASAAPAAIKARASAGRPAAAPAKAPRGRHFGSGLLKDKVMDALTAAGAEGIHVKELAAALNTKPVNIHSWFHSNIKRNPAIKKVTGGHYRLEGASSSASATSSKPSRKARTQKAEVKAAPAQGSRRGALKSQILSELAAAGPKGTTVRELADKLGTKYKNVYIWFSTTGKKGLGVEKIGKATYRLAA